MTRVKRGTTSLKRRKNVLKQAKGFRHGRSTKERQAHDALLHAGRYAFNDRREKKGKFRELWTVKINAATRKEGLSYSVFIDKLNKANVKLNRKSLSELAEKHPAVFSKVLAEVK